MNDAMEQIQNLANERHNLYKLAGKQRLTENQLSRLNEIEGRLPGLWDLHRRELAAVRKQELPRSFSYFEAA